MDYFAPQRANAALAQQVSPERLRLIPAAEALAAEDTTAPACIEFGPLDESALARAKDTARTLQAGISMAERRTDTSIFLELRSPGEIVLKQLRESLKGVSNSLCAES